jgi:hypothetical protein
MTRLSVGSTLRRLDIGEPGPVAAIADLDDRDHARGRLGARSGHACASRRTTAA